MKMNPRCNHKNTVHDTSTREILCVACGIVTNGFKKFVNMNPTKTRKRYVRTFHKKIIKG
ncbi:MAG TPA: hypothetical protein VLE02_00185 [Nitrosarchaeum sp.]|nr:hypothetical protein [Nitrosarchaeum sp.]